MTTIAAIDQGNSCCKVTAFSRHSNPYCRIFEADELSQIPAFLRQLGADGAAFCSVGDADRELLDSLALCLGPRLLQLSHSTPLPIKIAYGTPGTLGLDRIAAAVGAATLLPGRNLMVADAGTALTLDIVDAAPTFLCGNISPGLGMRLRALHHNTHRLPLVGKEGWLPEFGTDTETAIRCGCLRGMAAEITELYNIARKTHSVEALMLTGGDAPRLYPLLKELSSNVFAEPLLVAHGLYRIYLHNEAD